MERSLIEYAYEFVSTKKNSCSFADIWKYVVEKAGLDEETAKAKVSRFYTNLMLDGRFVTLGENIWDLRERHTFDKVHIDMKDVYTDVEEGDDDSEEREEEEEYNSEFKEDSQENKDNIEGFGEGEEESNEEEKEEDTF